LKVFTSVDLLTGALSANLVAVAVGPGDNSKFIHFYNKDFKRLVHEIEFNYLDENN
jgi:hypothetical protein